MNAKEAAEVAAGTILSFWSEQQAEAEQIAQVEQDAHIADVILHGWLRDNIQRAIDPFDQCIRELIVERNALKGKVKQLTATVQTQCRLLKLWWDELDTLKTECVGKAIAIYELSERVTKLKAALETAEAEIERVHENVRFLLAQRDALKAKRDELKAVVLHWYENCQRTMGARWFPDSPHEKELYDAAKAILAAKAGKEAGDGR